MGDLLNTLLEFLIDVVLFIPRIIFWAAVELLELGLGLLPDMSSIDPSQYTSGFTGDLLFFLSIAQFPQGVSIIMTALVARFFLRRMPVIG